MADEALSTIFPTATHWGNYRVEQRDGQIVAVHPYKVDKEPTSIRHNLLAALDPAVRVAQPMVRKSYLENPLKNRPHVRGREPYVPVEWAEALDLAADALRRAKDHHGNESIFGGSYGWGSAGRFHHAQSQIHRFLNVIGGYTSSANTYSIAAGEVIIPHILGMSMFSVIIEAPTAEDIAGNTKTMLLFGGAALKNSQVNPGGLDAHDASRQLKLMKDGGTKFINVSPIRSDVADFLDAEWVAVRPCSDVALMLGMAHTLYTERLHDSNFLQRYCVGFDRFLPYLIGSEDAIAKDAEWAAGLCGIDADLIKDLSRRVAAERSVIGVSWSLQRQEHGEQSYWMATVLAAMLGQIGLPGGGIAYGYGSAHNVGFGGRRISGFKVGALPQGKNPISSFIPVSRISEMLENPGGLLAYNGKTLRYPDIRVICWAGGNPFHHHQDLNRMRSAWEKPDAIIVNEAFWTGTARHADIVFPATTTLERNDLASGGNGTSVSPMLRVVAPFGQSRSDFEIFAGLAARFGLEEDFTAGRSEMEWVEHLYSETRANAANCEVALPPFAEFWAGEQIALSGQLPERSFALERFRSDPVANPLPTPSGKIEIFSDVIDSFGYADCAGHATWLEKDEWLGAPRAKQYPFHLISNQPRMKLHSQLDHGPASKSVKICGREPVRMNPQDAAARGITDGAIVRLFNDRGACLAGALLSSDISPSVLELATGAWYWTAEPHLEKPLEVHGNPNVLTRDKGSSSLAQGPTAHSCLVDVERFEGDLPDNDVFAPIPFLVMGES